jgi:leukotriene-A4 hydrolase
MPSYLFAIVVGELQQVKINHRNSVISEPCFVEKCAKEFEDMEKYLAALEKYISAYKWKEFNIVVLPLSFPFGGMENPNLTFLSPSVVVGDKSATSVVIHEMAHSWSGNGVTCQNWECFWLNEGMTVFFENEVYRELFGEEAYELKTVNGMNGLRKAIGVFGDTHSYTSLSPELK